MFHEKNQQFYFGLAVGIAVISTLGFFTLLISGGNGSGISFSLGGNGTAKPSAKAPKFEACIADTSIGARVDADFQEGGSLGVRGTPATFINGYLVSGALPFASVKEVIDTLLAGKKADDLEAVKDENGQTVFVENVPGLKENEPFKGVKNAPIFIAEYSDFECPFCARFEPTVTQILAEYGDKVTFVYRHFPLSFHPQARPAAIAAECAENQGKYWEMHAKLFELNTKQTMNQDAYIQAAKEIGLK
jgi:protein-disulfide isomerase